MQCNQTMTNPVYNVFREINPFLSINRFQKQDNSKTMESNSKGIWFPIPILAENSIKIRIPIPNISEFDSKN